MSEIIIHSVFEGEGYPLGKLVESDVLDNMKCQRFLSTQNECWRLTRMDVGHRLISSYFVGIDWIEENKEVISVRPKRISESQQADCIKMLTSVLEDPVLSEKCSEIYHLKSNVPRIEIAQDDDFLSPLIVFHFIQLVKKIVRKGLLKSYKNTSQNLSSKVKGKILTGKTIQRNHSRHEYHKTYCTFSEFTIDNTENRIIKVALRYCLRIIGEFDMAISQDEINYILPPFQGVSRNIDVLHIKKRKINSFYTEYKEALTLAQLILKRHGYNLLNINRSVVYSTPPFWIDMSKLFELYALSVLRRRFSNKVSYHFWMNNNELDYLLKSDDYKMVIDAKYKAIYKNSYYMDDMRQVAGYSRFSGVYKALDIVYPESIDVLIIYPDTEGVESFENLNLKSEIIPSFEGIYKVGISIPLIKVSDFH